MAQQWRVLFLGSGLLMVALAVFLLGGPPWQPAGAQPPAVAPNAAVGRYQMTSSFVIQNLTPGAYILDTQTGEVFQVIGKNAPESIGSVAKRKPKD